MSRVYFRPAECVPPRPGSIFSQQRVFRHVPLSISSRQSVFRHVPDRFPVDRLCSSASRIIFGSAECVLPQPGSISGRQSVFCHVPGRFPVGRVCSVTSWFDFRSVECVLPHPWSFSSRQSVFCHLPGRFPVGRVCSGVFSGCQSSFSPFFPKCVTYLLFTYGKKIRLLKYPFAVNARDLKTYALDLTSYFSNLSRFEKLMA